MGGVDRPPSSQRCDVQSQLRRYRQLAAGGMNWLVFISESPMRAGRCHASGDSGKVDGGRFTSSPSGIRESNYSLDVWILRRVKTPNRGCRDGVLAPHRSDLDWGLVPFLQRFRQPKGGMLADQDASIQILPA